MSSGARVVCPGCTRIFGRRSVFGRAIAALVLTVAAVIPSLAPLWRPSEDRTGIAYVIAAATRTCDTGSIDLLISSLIMRGRDLEAISIAEHFTAQCEPSDTMNGMIGRARLHLASP